MGRKGHQMHEHNMPPCRCQANKTTRTRRQGDTDGAELKRGIETEQANKQINISFGRQSDGSRIGPRKEVWDRKKDEWRR